ncbi:restriction endonuclease subunit S [Streptomyces sp. NPDC013187]|uniref:restriction endonuclease subunit S n=1 Tax=Streptomyces sp. NPDC013187 TaxID=3364865 RepID=UPI00369A6357
MTWTEVPFLQALRDVSSGNPKVPKSDFRDSGVLPVVDQGQGILAGYVDDPGLAQRNDLPVIIFGDHTRCFKYIDFPFAVGADGVKILAVEEGFDSRYVFWFLTSLDIPSAGYSRHYKYLKGFSVAKPPLAEQQRIAAVLDQVDALRSKRREAIALLDDLVQSIFLDMFGDPSVNSQGFEVRELETVIAEGDRINYGVVQPGRHVEDGIPLIRSGDLGRLGVDRSSLMRISPDIESCYSRSRITGNEILIGCVGAIGEVAIVSADDVGSNVARAVARVPVASDVDREYLAAYLRMDFAQQYFTRELRTVAQPTLNIKQIKSAPVVFPPSSMRSKFAERVRSVTQQRAAHVTHSATLDELFTSLQHRAFSGALWDHEATGEAA